MRNTVGMLSECIDHLATEAKELRVELSEENWTDLIERLAVPMSYDSQNRASVKCETKNGKPTRAYFCVCIVRKDNGRYEMMCNT